MYGPRRVLSSARIEARSGEVVLVAGRNGVGKSTLLRIISGDLLADSGTVHFDAVPFPTPRLHRLARLGLFYLPDRGLLSPLVKLRTQLETFKSRFETVLIEEAAEQLGILELLGRPPAHFSGGELRRAEIAAAVVRNPTCLIADEPLRGIDPRDADVILDCFVRLSRRGCAVVVSGHDMTPLLRAADRVVWVTAGTTYDLGAPQNAATNEHFRKDYLTGRWA
jgi:ABC-type multidrug transport system ATPase subunit